MTLKDKIPQLIADYKQFSQTLDTLNTLPEFDSFSAEISNGCSNLLNMINNTPYYTRVCPDISSGEISAHIVACHKPIFLEVTRHSASSDQIVPFALTYDSKYGNLANLGGAGTRDGFRKIPIESLSAYTDIGYHDGIPLNLNSIVFIEIPSNITIDQERATRYLRAGLKPIFMSYDTE